MEYEPINPEPKDLRSFGMTLGVIFVLLFGLFFPWLFDAEQFPLWPWVVCGVLFVPALLYPKALHPLYVVWMKLGYILAWINTRIVLGFVFFLIVTPMGLVMRLLGNDPMDRQPDNSASSYRVKSTREAKERLEKPF